MPAADPTRVSRRAGKRVGLALFVLALGLLVAAPAAAQDWHDAYHAGLAALARGDHARAAEALQRAATLRPEPGRNVLTYGTNVEPRYFPYLRLAEARLALGQLDAAREALERSASWGTREPAEERQVLLGRLEAAVAARRPPPPPAETLPAPATVATPTPAPAAPAAVEPPAPAPARAAPEEPAASAPAKLATPDARPRTEAPGTRAPRPTPGTTAQPASPSAPATGAIQAPSQPAVPATPEPAPRQAGDMRAILVAFALVAVAGAALIAWIALRRAPPAARPGAVSPRTGGATDAGAPATPRTFLNPGARLDEQGQEWFGEYRLLEMLGRGGMASVFKAERRNELVALKRPLASLLDDQQFLDRFLREAEIGRTLNHPNIVRILERGNVSGVPYFTMQLVEGETLLAFLRREGAVEPRLAASVVVQIAEALDFAHGKGVVHRDLKPSNIMLLPDGSARVMDFGIARAERFDTLTATSAFLGTPHYVAPEMIEGLGAEPRSDLYSLGVVLFELVTGQRPFVADTAFAVLKKHCLEEPPAPGRLRPGVPPELDAIVLQLLRKNVAERPANAEALVIALRDFIHSTA
jgi:outer membrane biosynthesis protein TonB